MPNNDKSLMIEENGAVVVEAMLSLTLFMFMIVSILSIANLCSIQVKIGTALNETAKEISEYMYIYSISGINSLQQENYDNAEDTRHEADELVSSISTSMSEIDKLGNKDGSAWDAVGAVNGSIETVEELILKIQQSEDKSEWIKDVVRIAANEGFEMLKGGLGGVIAEKLMQKNLTLSDSAHCDEYLRRMGVVSGLKGIDCSESRLFLNGSDDIILCCQYELHVIEFFGQSVHFTIRQYAYTKAWGGKEVFSVQGIPTGSLQVVGDGEGAKFGEYVKKVSPASGYVDVAIHTDGNGHFIYLADGEEAQTLTVQQLADKIKAGAELHQGEGIRLFACGAGADDAGLAQELANAMGVKVSAPSDTVWVYPNGKVEIGPEPGQDTGEWKVFEPK